MRFHAVDLQRGRSASDGGTSFRTPTLPQRAFEIFLARNRSFSVSASLRKRVTNSYLSGMAFVLDVDSHGVSVNSCPCLVVCCTMSLVRKVDKTEVEGYYVHRDRQQIPKIIGVPIRHNRRLVDLQRMPLLQNKAIADTIGRRYQSNTARLIFFAMSLNSQSSESCSERLRERHVSLLCC